MPKRDKADRSYSPPKSTHDDVGDSDVDFNMVYHLMCICNKCARCFKVLVARGDLPEKLIEMIEQIRCSPDNVLEFSEWEQIASSREIYQRLLLLRLMDKEHGCFSKIKKDRFPDIGIELPNDDGKLLQYNMLAQRGRGEQVLPVLHEINTKHFAFLPQRTVFLDVFFTVSQDMLLHDSVTALSEKKVKSKRKKKQVKMEDSISLEE